MPEKVLFHAIVKTAMKCVLVDVFFESRHSDFIPKDGKVLAFQIFGLR